MKILYPGLIQGGKLILKEPLSNDFERKLKRWEGKSVVATLELLRDDRSNAQNAYYWGVVMKMLAEDLGYDDYIIHGLMKEKFNPLHTTVVNKKTGEIEEHIVGDTTTDLSTVEFSDYCDKIRAWAAEYRGLNIPNPNEAESE